MGTVCEGNGWKIVVNSGDHTPAHVHVFHGGRTCRVTIGKPGETPPAYYPWKKRKRNLMSPKERVQAVLQVAEHQADALAKWEEIHGKVE